MGEVQDDQLSDLLPLYYKRLYPHALISKWISYGDANYFANRELSFTLLGDIYIRYLSFDNPEEFIQELQRRNPVKIDVGAVYNSKPKDRRGAQGFAPVEKEIVFDIDLTDYDDVRTCCKGANVCKKCWKFMAIACKVLDRALKEDFGFRHMMWVFSGRRGVHCWICDEEARKLDDDGRSAIADYMQVLRGTGNQAKKVILPYENIHEHLTKSLEIIDQYFMDIVREQDILGTEDQLVKFIGLLADSMRTEFEAVLRRESTSEQRWNLFVAHFTSRFKKGQIPKNQRNLIEELKLQFSYPRLDINVTRGLNHLLKAPFCVHPKSGKISVPFPVKIVDKFDPDVVPTITLLVDEINLYDVKTKEQEENLGEKQLEEGHTTVRKIKDYKKTSLLKSTNLFEEFIRGLEKAKSRTHMEI